MAVKFEPENMKDGNLFLEIVWLKRYGDQKSGLSRVPKYYTYGEYQERRFLIMQHIDHSLDQYLAVKSDGDPRKRHEVLELLSAQML